MKPPRFIWADYDPTARRALRWVFYRTKSEQRANRPDLRPIRFRIRQNIASQTAAPKTSQPKS